MTFFLTRWNQPDHCEIESLWNQPDLSEFELPDLSEFEPVWNQHDLSDLTLVSLSLCETNLTLSEFELSLTPKTQTLVDELINSIFLKPFELM